MTQGILRGRFCGVYAALWLLGMALVPCALARPACVASGQLPKLLPVLPDLWRVPVADGGFGAQLLLAREGTGQGTRLWLIGSGPTPAFGARLDCAIRRHTGRAVTDVVNTRAAAVLALGNPAFAGARLWALPEVSAALRVRCGACLQHMKTQLGDEAGASLEPADIQLPRRAVRATRLGPFDTLTLHRAPGDAVLVLRHRRSGLVLAQGLFWAGAVPDLRETDSQALLDSLQALQGFAGRALLLGEQGGPAPGKALQDQIAYIDALRQAVGRALQRGDLPGAGQDLPVFSAWPGYAERHPINGQRVWRELEDAWLSR